MVSPAPAGPAGWLDVAAPAMPAATATGRRLFETTTSASSTRRDSSPRSPVAIDSSAMVAPAGWPIRMSWRSSATRG